jgi:hypothetical protein
MAAESSRVLYRLVQTDPPTIRDFLSNEELGRRPRRRLSGRDRERWRGVSHYDSVAAATVTGRASPWHGPYIAAVRIPAGGPVRVEQTGRDPSHYPVWADAAVLLSWMMSVIPVEAVH